MLTDEEIQSVYSEFLDVKGSAMEFARRIERAVLAKAGDQEPQVIGRVHYVDDSIYGCLNSIGRKLEDGAPLYAHPLPAQAIPEGWKLVPVEPTVDMDDEYARASGQHHLSLRGYKAMLSASPKP